MSRGNRRFLLTNLLAQIWGVTATQQTVPYKLTVAYVTPHKLKTKQH